MYDIRADVKRHCLLITLRGFLQPDEAKEAADKVISEAEKLATGFTIVNDISEFKPASEEAAAHIKRAQGAMAAKGAKKVIRIVGASVLGKHQFNRTQKEAQAGYESIEVATMDDALKLL